MRLKKRKIKIVTDPKLLCRYWILCCFTKLYILSCFPAQFDNEFEGMDIKDENL